MRVAKNQNGYEPDAPALRRAEELIAKWDSEGGMTYRQLASRLREIFAEEVSQIVL
jgi:hypothetical protein